MAAGEQSAQAAGGPASPGGDEAAARLVIAAGVCAALHVGKVAPAIPALQQAGQLQLVEAGFLLSLVQFAGMCAGVAFGALADGLGLRRSLLIGLAVLSAASAAGGLASGGPALMALRAAEGFGFLLVVLSAPGLVRQLVPPQRLARAMGVWGGYMPLATAIALVLGPLVIEAAGWRAWWWGLAAATAAMALVATARVPKVARAGRGQFVRRGLASVRDTLRAPGPWWLATCFACYSGQWLAVVGFLPTIYREAGLAPMTGGLLSAVAVGANVVGNVVSGRLLHRGAGAGRLLAAGYVTMAIAALAAFAPLDQPAVLRWFAVVIFSMVGGVIPGTLFALVVRAAPGEHAMSSTVGWIQQWSSLGQFLGPPAVAWLANRNGGWEWTWLATGAAATLGLAISAGVARLPQRPVAHVTPAPRV